MGLGADPDSPQPVSVDLSAGQRIARPFDGHGDDILVHSGNSFLFDRQGCLAARPNAGDLRRREAVARHVRAIAGDPNRAGGLE